ncbi:IclR family transcriptional regulator [Paraburkholderia sp. RL18-101-BIB-B]|uniref:IclR family transcriptional regulator n=1 Tax=unclassified Paraburkholderia TaxID=2615204 RepID=UPI0038B8E6B3
MTEKKLNSVDAVKVSVRIMEAMALAQRAMGVTELADLLSETKPRVHRHLVTLKEVGMIEQDASNDRYRLGWRIFQLGEAAGNQFDLRRLAQPYLLDLRDALHETVVLAVPTNGLPMVIDSVDNIYARICVSVKPGNRPPPHCSALGRVTMAFATETERQALVGDLLKEDLSFSKAALTRLEKRLARIRSTRFDVCAGEMMPGINTLAVPVFRDGATLAGVIAIIGSVESITEPPAVKQLSLLHHAASELSRHLHGDVYALDVGGTPA